MNTYSKILGLSSAMLLCLLITGCLDSSSSNNKKEDEGKQDNNGEKKHWQLTKIEKRYSANETPFSTETFTWDNEGKLAADELIQAEQEDINREYEYINGKLSAITHVDAPEITSTFTYNENKKTIELEQDGVLSVSHFDDNSLPIKLEAFLEIDNDWQLVETRSYQYQNERLVSEISDTGTEILITYENGLATKITKTEAESEGGLITDQFLYYNDDGTLMKIEYDHESEGLNDIDMIATYYWVEGPCHDSMLVFHGIQPIQAQTGSSYCY